MPLRSSFTRSLRSLFALAAVAVAPAVHGAEPFGIDSPTPSPPALSGTDQAVVARYWELGPSHRRSPLTPTSGGQRVKAGPWWFPGSVTGDLRPVP
jgi:hypothetical protein